MAVRARVLRHWPVSGLIHTNKTKMNKHLHLFVILALCAGLLSGCDWFEEPKSDDTIPTGVTFYTNANLGFFFLDGEGNDLVDMQEPATYPVLSATKIGSRALEEAVGGTETYQDNGRSYTLYANSHNWLFKDEGENLTCFGSHLWGRTVEAEYTSYVYAAGGMDSITVSYKYLTANDGVRIDGGGWAVEVESVLYNGVEVFKNNENGKVFIQKPSREETVVKVGRR